MSRDIEAVIFDMGGVIVRLRPIEEVLAGAGIPSDEIWERWILSESVRTFEAGRCDVDEFAAGLVVEMGIDITPAEMIERVARFPDGLYDGAVEMVRDVHERCTTGILSNTNALHWGNQKHHEIVQGLFDREYLSFQLGMVKPDSDIYEHAAADLGLASERVLFLDDNQVNVDGARAVGMRSALVKGPVESRAALVEFGVLDR